jgi:hypothetical protein
LGDKINAERVWKGKPERQRLLGKPRHIYENNIKMNIKEDGRIWTGFL